MKRRIFFATPLLLAGCGLATRPYVQRRDWAFAVRRPTSVAAPSGAPVLLVRALVAGPGMEERGLQTRLPDGQVRIAFYDRWAVEPAQGIGDALRAWLLASGKFSAVLGPASLANPSLVLEGAVDALYIDGSTAHASLGMRVLAMDGPAPRIRLQREVETTAPVAGTGAAAEVAGMNQALAAAFAEIEAAV